MNEETPTKVLEPQEGQKDILAVLYDFVQGSSQVAGVFDDWLTVADEISARIPYETAVAVGQHGREGQDVNRWVIGSMGAAMIGGVMHGQKVETLNQYALDIGVPGTTIREWVDTAIFWPAPVLKALREKYGDMLPPWTMFNRARRGLNKEDAQMMIEQAADHGWSVNKMEAEAAKLKGKSTTPDARKDALHRAINGLVGLSGIGLASARYQEVNNLKGKLNADLTTLVNTGNLPR